MANRSASPVTEACQPYVRGGYGAIFAQLSREDLEHMLVFLSGFTPLGFEKALARWAVQR